MPYNSYKHHWPVLAFFKGDPVSFVDTSSLNVLEHLGLFFPLMIIDDFHIVAMALTPDKTDSPLIIDPNRVLPFPIASQVL
jgi:hypothetical protein